MKPRVQILTRDNFHLHRTARRHLEAGYPIIPLQPKGKSPLNPGGCNAPITRRPEFDAYIAEHPKLNYGIVTGEESGLVVFDIDGEIGEGLSDSLRRSSAPCRRPSAS